MSSSLLRLEEEIFKVIANQKRLEIILLLENRELNVSHMAEMLGLRQANLSQHLSLLRIHGLVAVQKKGRESFYSLADQSIAKSIRLIHEFLRSKHHSQQPIDKKSLFPIVVDPVCGMRLSASQAYSHVAVGANIYYFCASGCEATFKAQAENA